jgi:alanyl-tRNA synthetase
VRRIEAATGAAALAHLKAQAALAKAISSSLKAPMADLPERVAQLQEERRRLERELGEAKKKLALAGGGSAAAPAGPEQVGPIRLMWRVLNDVSPKDLRGIVDQDKAALVSSGVSANVAISEGRASIAVGVTPDLASTALTSVSIVQVGVAALGGKGGGGRADFAQGGGPDAGNVEEAHRRIREHILASKAG